jgi:hypothetical protein
MHPLNMVAGNLRSDRGLGQARRGTAGRGKAGRGWAWLGKARQGYLNIVVGRRGILDLAVRSLIPIVRYGCVENQRRRRYHPGFEDSGR